MHIDNEERRIARADEHFGALGIQRIFRGIQGQRRAKMYRPQRAATTLQASWRAFIGKNRVRLMREALAMKTCATRIQSQWRVGCHFRDPNKRELSFIGSLTDTAPLRQTRPHSVSELLFDLPI